jgi:hypothetical protein
VGRKPNPVSRVAGRAPRSGAAEMRLFLCPVCAQQLYFDSSSCLNCGSDVAFSPERMQMVALGAEHRACVRRAAGEGCNWVAAPHLCRSCELTDPSSVAGTGDLRARAEAAKRHLLYTLLHLDIAFAPKRHESDTQGLRFVWTWSGPGPQQRTGHADGTITLDLNEADDAHREAARVNFGEPQRTVLGHLRHEIGHHLYQRCIDGSAHRAAFRNLFGDERADYAAALQAHYAQGPPADWPERHISAYASAHPWEDWAETCAHYLLMADAVETAAAWGLELAATERRAAEADAAATPIDRLLFDHWLPIARFMNAMSRSLGLADSYPYLLAEPVIAKLRFVQAVLAKRVTATSRSAE